jgi:hypothetical protein
MTLDLVPDVERVVHAFLDSAPDVAALNTRLVGRTPKDTGTAWTRISLLDERPVSPVADHIVNALLQIDIYAGSQPDVLTHARTIRAALQGMPAATHASAVVNAVTVIGMARVPDTDYSPARERVILTIELVAHAA